MQIIENLHILGGADKSSNCYLIDGKILVDPGLPIFSRLIMESIENLGFKLKNIKVIINTHRHFDHIGANKLFRDFCRAEIWVHEKEVDGVAEGKYTYAEMFNHKYLPVTVTRKLKEGDVIKTKNFKFEVLHTPGHTKGSICLYDEENKILISGDTILDNTFGRTDLKTGSLKDMKKSLEKLRDLEVRYLLPGHGLFKVGTYQTLMRNLIKKVNEFK